MPTLIFLSVIYHHGDAGDPYLLEWIKQRLDNLLDLSPWMIVVFLGLAILILPILTVCFYVIQKRRSNSDSHPSVYS